MTFNTFDANIVMLHAGETKNKEEIPSFILKKIKQNQDFFANLTHFLLKRPGILLILHKQPRMAAEGFKDPLKKIQLNWY